MKKLIVNFVLASACLFGQYTIAPGGGHPSEVGTDFGALLEKKGTKLMKGSKEIGEFW